MDDHPRVRKKRTDVKIYDPRPKWYNMIILPPAPGEQKENEQAKHKENR